MNKQLVRIKKEWCDCNEEHDIIHYVVSDQGEKLIISPLEWKWRIVPQELVRREMIEFI